MPNVEMPDGKIIEFPDTMSKQEIDGILSKQYPSKQYSTMQKVTQTALPYAKPALEIGGAVLGGVVGGTGGAMSPTAPVTSPAGAIAGAGLGYAGGSRIARKLEDYAYDKKPDDILTDVSKTGKDFVIGAGLQAGGPIIDKTLSVLGKKIATSGAPEWIMSRAIKTPTGARWQKTLPETEYTAREAVVGKMLKEDINPNKYGRAVADKRISEIQDQVADIVSKIPKENTTGSYDIIKSLNPLKQEAKFSSIAEEAVPAISKIEQSVIKKGLMNPEEMQMLKQQFYKDINWDRTKPIIDSAGRFTENARKAIAHEAMVRLEGFAPELKALNKNEAIYLDMQKAIEKTIERYENSNVMGIGAKILSLRNIGLAMSEMILGTPSMKATLARTLYKAGNRQGYSITKAISNQRGSIDPRVALLTGAGAAGGGAYLYDQAKDGGEPEIIRNIKKRYEMLEGK
jgi:hypothetical protein